MPEQILDRFHGGQRRQKEEKSELKEDGSGKFVEGKVETELQEWERSKEVKGKV